MNLKLLIVALFSFLVSISLAGTSLVREIAKNDTPVEIYYGGDLSKANALRISGLVLHHPDFNKKVDIKVLPLAALKVRQATEPPTIIVVRCQDEHPVQVSEAALAPVIPANDPRTAQMSVAMTNPKVGPMAFTVLLQAPSAKGLDQLTSDFEKFSANNWRDLHCENVAPYNRLSILGSAGTPTWASTFNEVSYHAMDEVPAEGDLAILWDRSATKQVPEIVKNTFPNLKWQPLTVICDTVEVGGRRISLLTAPNQRLLLGLTKKFATPYAIPVGGISRLALDLRTGKRTVVSVTGIADQVYVEPSRILLENILRTQGNLNVLQHGTAAAIQDQDLLEVSRGANETSESLRSKLGVRWLLMLEATSIEGGTSYVARRDCLTNEPAAYAVSKPQPPERHPLFGHTKTDAEMAKATEKYKIDLADWERARYKYEEQDSVSWKRTVLKRSSADVRLTLKVIDLDGDVTKVAWESEVPLKNAEVTVYKSDKVNVSGHKLKPENLRAPNPDTQLDPALTQKTLQVAIDHAVVNLMDECMTPSVSGEPSSSDPGVEKAPRIISIDSPLVTIDIGEKEGLKIGDRVEIDIYREIINPDTKEVIERVLKETCVLQVVRVGKTSDCKAINAAQLKQLSSLKIGDKVRHVSPR